MITVIQKDILKDILRYKIKRYKITNFGTSFSRGIFQGNLWNCELTEKLHEVLFHYDLISDITTELF